jgi:nucleoside-diphosphate-sugar epimerase
MENMGIKKSHKGETMKKIIVTGHVGYIGALIVPLLLEKGYDVVGIDTNYYDKDCELFEFKPEINEIKKDIRKVNESDLEGAYAICHFAALSNDPVGALNPELTFDINHKASVRLAKLAKKVGIEKFIYSSSCSLYGIAGTEDPLAEDAQFNPVTAYAKSKVFSEQDILPLGDKDFSVTFLRNSTAYGISPKLRLDLVVNNLIGWAITTKKIKILSDGTPWRPLIHAEDIARAFISVIEALKKEVNKESFNVGINSENFQIKDIAYMVKEVVPNCEVIITGEHGSDSRTYRVDFNKIENELPNFNPKWNLRKGIEQIYEYYSKYKMDEKKFNGRYFIRMKQLQYLIENKKVDQHLFWT